jgi:hypothetical protein
VNDWKIGTRIGAGFGVVILIAMALGLFAINHDKDFTTYQ